MGGGTRQAAVEREELRAELAASAAELAVGQEGVRRGGGTGNAVCQERQAFWFSNGAFLF